MSKNPDRFKVPHNRDLTRTSYEEFPFIDYRKQARQLALEFGHFLDGKGNPVRPGLLPAATIDIATHAGTAHLGCAVVLRCDIVQEDWGGSSPLREQSRFMLQGLIQALSALRNPHAVTVTCASVYLVDTMMRGRAHRWRREGWTKRDGDPAKYKDLWEQILSLGDRHRLRFESSRATKTAGMRQAEALAVQRLVNRSTNGGSGNSRGTGGPAM